MEPGTVVVTTAGVNGLLEPVYELAILGKRVSRWGRVSVRASASASASAGASARASAVPVPVRARM